MKKNLYLLFLIIFISACSGLNKLSLYNLSGQYNNNAFTTIPTVAFNSTEGNAEVFVSLLMTDLVVGFDEENNRDYRKAVLSYELFETYESKQILDSAEIMILDSSLFLLDTIVKLSISYPGNEKYILKVELTDLNRVDAVTNLLVLNNINSSSRNNFLLRDDMGDMMFSNCLSEDDEFYFELADTIASEVYVRYYQRDFPLALPPFLEETETNFDYEADSVFVLTASKGRTGLLNFPKTGFYHLQLDTNGRAGYTVFRFDDGFPFVVSMEQMLQPLRYITSMTEFRDMDDAVDQKLAIDNFWLEISGNPTRARSMIQKYYGRVVDANNYFTSYHEGWKTDRGLIYIVYGPPRIVYRGKGVEEWLYGEKGNKNSIRLQFVKVLNPFSENDYSLIKSPAYREKWYNIVNTWRR